MEKTPHVILSGDGVQEFAQKYNVPTEESLMTSQAIEALEQFKQSGAEPSRMEIGYG